MASIKDVAQKAGVGVGTVSRVLNNSGYVSDETREKIEEAMKNLQYTPNELARNLYHKKSGIIAVLVPTVEIPFFAELVHDIEAELYNEGFKIMLCNTDKAHNAELEYLDMLNRHIVDGVITGVHSLDVEEYKKIKNQSLHLTVIWEKIFLWLQSIIRRADDWRRKFCLRMGVKNSTFQRFNCSRVAISRKTF